MNRVSILTAALGDRRSELEQAVARVATYEQQVTAAQADYDRTNGDLEHYRTARDVLEHRQHLLEQGHAAVEQCKSNVACASTALANAQRETRIDELAQQRATRRTQGAALAREALTHYEQLASTLRQIDELQKQDPADVSALRALDQSAYPWFAVDALFLELMTANAGHAALAYVSGPSGFRSREYETAKSRGLASVVAPLFEVVAMPADRIAAFRANLGDSKMLDALPPQKPEPLAKPWQAEAVRDSVEARRFQGFSYSVECWCVPPRGELEYRLQLPNTMPYDSEKILSEETVTLEHSLPARIVTLQGGRRVLLAPSKPSLTSRAIDRLVGASPE